MESKVQAESSKATWLDPHFWFKIHSFYIFIFFIIHALLKELSLLHFIMQSQFYLICDLLFHEKDCCCSEKNPNLFYRIFFFQALSFLNLGLACAQQSYTMLKLVMDSFHLCFNTSLVKIVISQLLPP